MAGLRLIVSGSNAEAIQKAVGKIRAFLDSVGAKYQFHDSGKSDSAYFHVKEPAKVAEDPWNPDVVDTRVSDHTLPQVYDPPDLDVSVPKPRPRAVSPDFAVKLLKDFMKGKIDIDEGEVIPVDSSLKERPVSGFHGLYRKALYPILSSFILSKIVYHGTPGKVGDAGEFSTSFINTGEGAQAFGWGLYFAENKGVAEWYRQKLNEKVSNGCIYSFNGESFLRVDGMGNGFHQKNGVDSGDVADGTPDGFALSLLISMVFPYSYQKERLTSLITDLFALLSRVDEGDDDCSRGGVFVTPAKPGVMIWIDVGDYVSQKFDTLELAGAFLQKVQNCLNRWFTSGDYAKVKKQSEESGYVYEVNIKVPDEYFLLEDSNWQGQSAYVRNCLSKATNSIIRKSVQYWHLQKPTLSGNYFLRYLYKELGGKGGAFSDRSDAKMESVLLLRAGIHGYKFLDGKSRSSGGGFFNYVVIDENDIETVQHQVKDEETGQVDLFTQEQYVQPAKRAVASFQRILSAFCSGVGVVLPDLADLLNATQADIHFMHFYAGGQNGKWDEVHDICSDYYLRLGEAYDDVAELCLQLDLDVSHPNDSASAVGFSNSKGSLGATFQYDEAMGVIMDRVRNLVDVAAEVAGGYQGRDPDSTAVRKYLEDFIAEWSKEAGYKLQGRLNGLLDFGGSYRDRVTDEQLGNPGTGKVARPGPGKVARPGPGRELIAGDVEEPVF
jgi:hypothetical protein